MNLKFEKVLEDAVQTVILPVSERFSGCSVRRAYQKSDLQFPSISVRATGISDEWPGKLLMFSAEISIFIATYMVDDPEEKTLDEISSAVREILFDRSTPLLDRISAAAPELSVFAVVVGDAFKDSPDACRRNTFQLTVKFSPRS